MVTLTFKGCLIENQPICDFGYLHFILCNSVIMLMIPSTIQIKAKNKT